MSTKTKLNINEVGLSPIFAGLTLYKANKLPVMGVALDVYSSPKIEEIFFSKIKKSTIIKPILKKVKEGLDNKKILIGYTNDNSFYFLYDKLQRFFKLKNTYSLGYFDPGTETLYILLDDNVSIMGNEIYKLDMTLAHELIHLAAFQYKRTDLLKNTYKKFLAPYYATLIGSAIGLITNKKLKFDDHVRKEFLKSLNKLFELNESDIGFIEEKMKNSYRIWMEFLNNATDIDTEICDKICRFLMYPYYKNYLDRSYTQFSFDDLDKVKYSESLYIRAYAKIGIKDTNTIAGQEFIFPSEILSISNQRGLHKELITSINRIDME